MLARRLIAAFVLSTLLTTTLTASAAPKDDKANKSYKQAMEEDYLDTRFEDAEKKLRGALDSCGGSGCSAAVKAKLYMGLGVVLIGGLGKKEDGKQAFIDGLKLDKSAAPEADFVTTDIKNAYDEAKKGGGSGPGPGPTAPPDGPMSVLPIAEQKVNTPVPLHVALDEDLAKKVTGVTVTYVPAGGGGEKVLDLEKSGRAFRANIPCAAVARKGVLKYWVVAKDKKGKEAAKAGSSDDPITTSIKADIDGKPPSWPGFAPPEPCAGGAAADPDPDESGSSKRQCVDDKDCPSGESCATNECLKKPSGGGGGEGGGGAGDDEPSKAKMNWIRLTFAPDFAMISGVDVCGFQDGYSGDTPVTPNDETFVCVRNADSENRTRYLGQATPGQGNNVNFGFGVATMRLMLGYDRVLIKGLSIGARVGWAFNGTNEDFASFIPVHAEGKIAYTFGKDPFAGQVARPWIFISGGLAQVDTIVNVDVLEDGEACGAAEPADVSSPCANETSDGATQERIQTLRAIKQGGLGFAGGGAGVSFVPVDLFEINLGVKFSVTFPFVVPVFSPEVGVGVGF